MFRQRLKKKVHVSFYSDYVNVWFYLYLHKELGEPVWVLMVKVTNNRDANV